jgi:hypothetical protein
MRRVDAVWLPAADALSALGRQAPDESTRGRSERDQWRAAWERVIDQKLNDWASDPDQLADDGILPPSPQSIAMASQIARLMRARGFAPPTSVVPDGDGGISFERAHGRIFEKIEIEGSSIEYLLFEDCRLCHRGPFIPGAP